MLSLRPAPGARRVWTESCSAPMRPRVVRREGMRWAVVDTEGVEMRWYAASFVLYFKTKASSKQHHFTVWENVDLIRASSLRQVRKAR